VYKYLCHLHAQSIQEPIQYNKQKGEESNYNEVDAKTLNLLILHGCILYTHTSVKCPSEVIINTVYLSVLNI
jgi:hypothetical protein